jgi:hypothetical protein
MQIRPFTKAAVALTLAAVLSVAAAAPGGASGARAHAAGNEPESAAGALFSVVRSAYARDVSGRSIETDCGGRKSPYSCSWWIIKGSKERRKVSGHASDSPSSGILLRSGEGTVHVKNRSRIYKSGYASAAYNSRTGGFSVKLG